MRRLSVAASCMCMWIAALTLHAQNRELVLQFPRDGLVGVSNRPVITITAPDSILPESITFQYPDVPVGGSPSSVPTIHLVEANTPLRTGSVPGTYELVDAHTLTFTPFYLKPGTTYHLTVQGLEGRALTPFPSTIPYQTHSSQFTTAPSIPALVSCNIATIPYLGCTEPIVLQFDGDVAHGLGRPERFISILEVTNSGETAPLPVSLQVDGSQVRVLPHEGRWRQGAVLYVTVDPSPITGDTVARYEGATQIRSATRLDIRVREKNGNPLSQDIVSAYNQLDQIIASNAITLTPLTPPDESYRFIRWESPHIASLLTHFTGQTTLKSHVTIPCDLYRDTIVLTAIVERIDSMPLTITVGDGGLVEIYDRDHQLIGRVTDSLTLTYRPADGDMRVIARPASGYRFTSWQAPYTCHHTAPSPAIVINQAVVMQGLSGSLTSLMLTPNFNVQYPSGSPPAQLGEIFRLTATITDMDPDPGFNAGEGVFFTTKSAFEDVIQRTERVCVKAQPCWQIVGYSITGTGFTEWLDPVQEYCVAAELLSPENTVVFYVERKPLHLRIDHIVMRDDDPASRVVGKRPPSGSYVEVEKRSKTITGATRWARLHQSVCEDDDQVAFNPYQLRCGDVVRLTCRSSEVTNLHWRFFQDLPRYIIPSLVEKGDTYSVYELVIDDPLAHFTAVTCDGVSLQEREVRLRACFQQAFGIEAISMKLRVYDGKDRKTATFVERWTHPLLVRELQTDEPKGGRQMEYIPFYGTEVKVAFTYPIDIRTIYNGGLQVHSFSNVIPEDPLADNLSFTASSSDAEHVSFEPVDGRMATTAVFRLCDPSTTPRMQALYCGFNRLSVFNTVTSSDGVPLRATVNILLNTMELPPLFVQWDNVEYEFDGDNDFWIIKNYGDTYQALFGANVGQDGFHHVTTTVQQLPDCSDQQGTPPGECTTPYDDKGPPLSFGQRVVWAEPLWMDYGDKLWWQVVSYDEDCKDQNDCLVNRLPTLLDDIEGRIKKYEEPYVGGTISQDRLLLELLGIGITTLRTAIAPDDQDEYLGEATMLEGFTDLWGVHTATTPLKTLRHSNATYRMRVRLLPYKSVVR